MCGLTTKLQSSDIFDFINKYDIVCLTETKTDKCDIINIPNFDVFCKHRSNLSYRKHGGIFVCIRTSFSGFCSIVKNEFDHVLWIRLEGKAYQ